MPFGVLRREPIAALWYVAFLTWSLDRFVRMALAITSKR